MLSLVVGQWWILNRYLLNKPINQHFTILELCKKSSLSLSKPPVISPVYIPGSGTIEAVFTKLIVIVLI